MICIHNGYTYVHLRVHEINKWSKCLVMLSIHPPRSLFQNLSYVTNCFNGLSYLYIHDSLGITNRAERAL